MRRAASRMGGKRSGGHDFRNSFSRLGFHFLFLLLLGLYFGRLPEVIHVWLFWERTEMWMIAMWDWSNGLTICADETELLSGSDKSGIFMSRVNDDEEVTGVGAAWATVAVVDRTRADWGTFRLGEVSARCCRRWSSDWMRAMRVALFPYLDSDPRMKLWAKKVKLMSHSTYWARPLDFASCLSSFKVLSSYGFERSTVETSCLRPRRQTVRVEFHKDARSKFEFMAVACIGIEKLKCVAATERLFEATWEPRVPRAGLIAHRHGRRRK